VIHIFSFPDSLPRGVAGCRGDHRRRQGARPPCMGSPDQLAARRSRAPARARGAAQGRRSPVFGRLAEQIDAGRTAAVDFEVVPGVTAATAPRPAPGSSLTARGSRIVPRARQGSDHAGRGVPPSTGNWGRARRRHWSLYAGAGARVDRDRAHRHGRDERERALVVERAGSSTSAWLTAARHSAAREAGVRRAGALSSGPAGDSLGAARRAPPDDREGLSHADYFPAFLDLRGRRVSSSAVAPSRTARCTACSSAARASPS